MMCEADSAAASVPALTLTSRAHHAQSALCEARAPYRQGRRLTAVKVYSVCAESAHMLVCGVPALGLRRELRDLFARHGRLLLLASAQPTADAEPFTCTYRVRYADVRAARAAKRAHDTRNWYGGSLHVCYAPELESAAETREKLALRRRDVASRLRLLHRQQLQAPLAQQCTESIATGEVVAGTGGEQPSNRKRRRAVTNTVVLEKQYRPCFVEHTTHNAAAHGARSERAGGTVQLNYDKFGGEDVRAAPPAIVNRIQFNISKRK